MKLDTEERTLLSDRDNKMAVSERRLMGWQRKLRLQEPQFGNPSWLSLPAELRQHILYYIFDSFMYPSHLGRISTAVNRQLSTCLFQMSAISTDFEQSDLIPATEQYARVLITERGSRTAGGAWVSCSVKRVGQARD